MSSTFLHVLIYDWGLYPRNSSERARVFGVISAHSFSASFTPLAVEEIIVISKHGCNYLSHLAALVMSA